MSKVVFALANNRDHADLIVKNLITAGIPDDNISVLISDKEGQLYFEDTNNELQTDYFESSVNPSKKNKGGELTHEKHSKAPEGGVIGAAAGGIIGGSLGLLAQIGLLSVPGVGPFIAAGPLMAALSGTAIGGGVGLVVGALVGLGLPEFEAVKYEKKVRDGGVLVCVHVDNEEEIENVENHLEKDGAKDICSTSEKT